MWVCTASMYVTRNRGGFILAETQQNALPAIMAPLTPVAYRVLQTTLLMVVLHTHVRSRFIDDKGPDAIFARLRSEIRMLGSHIVLKAKLAPLPPEHTHITAKCLVNRQHYYLAISARSIGSWVVQ